MINNDDSFFAEPINPRLETRALALEVICRLLLWMADGATLEDRGLPRFKCPPGTSSRDSSW